MARDLWINVKRIDVNFYETWPLKVCLWHWQPIDYRPDPKETIEGICADCRRRELAAWRAERAQKAKRGTHEQIRDQNDDFRQ